PGNFDANAAVAHLHVPHHLGTGTRHGERDARNVSLVQSEAGSIELGETNVLPGVLDTKSGALQVRRVGYTSMR
ncbi:hypothetical protein, partial [Klebsiella pneumoniae]|uniref:hypothetical protein n=1 Tax=Klebsiella pneumoniae TaxID=573 RepID=UPI0031365F13